MNPIEGDTNNHEARSNHVNTVADPFETVINPSKLIAMTDTKHIPLEVLNIGSDRFKALALGADFCWIGKAVMWGLAYKGEAGVKLALDLLYDKFLSTMILVGVNRIRDIGRQHLAWVNADGSLRYLDEDEE